MPKARLFKDKDGLEWLAIHADSGVHFVPVHEVLKALEEKRLEKWN